MPKKRSAIETIKELDRKHRGFRATLDELLGKGKPIHWVVGSLRHQFQEELEEREIAAYISQRQWELDAEDSGNDGCSPAAAAPPGAQREAKIGAKEETVPPGTMRQEIVSVMRGRIARMLHAAKADTSSDAAEMISILLLDQMANEDAKFDDVNKLFDEQRRREQIEKELELNRAKLKQVIIRDREKTQALRGAKGLAKDAGKALRQGRVPDAEAMLKQIDAVIGITGELVERVESRA